MNWRASGSPIERENLESQQSVGIDRCAAVLAGNLNANEGTLESDAGAVPINVGVTSSKPFFGPGLCRFCALEIDFRGELGGFRKCGHAIRQDLRETAN